MFLKGGSVRYSCCGEVQAAGVNPTFWSVNASAWDQCVRAHLRKVFCLRFCLACAQPVRKHQIHVVRAAVR